MLRSLMMLEQATAYSLRFYLHAKAWTQIKIFVGTDQSQVQMCNHNVITANYVSKGELAFPKRHPLNWALARTLS